MKSQRHENLLYAEIDRLQDEGWHVLDVRHTLPDAIAISPEGKIVAIEVLGKKRRTDPKGRSKGYVWDGGKSVNQKRFLYQRYDDIIFILFDRSGSDWKLRVVASEEWPHLKPDGITAKGDV